MYFTDRCILNGALLAVVDGEALEEQAAKTGAGATAARVEDHET